MTKSISIISTNSTIWDRSVDIFSLKGIYFHICRLQGKGIQGAIKKVAM